MSQPVSQLHSSAGARRGGDYIASLRDGRSVMLDGAQIADVTLDQRFRGAIETVGSLYDMQHDPNLVERMTFRSPTSGNRVGMSFLQPKSAEDLRRRGDMTKLWADSVGGMMGRSPDFLNVLLSAYAADAAAFSLGGEQFGRNIVAYQEFVRDNDLAMTHSLIAPEIDKSRPPYDQPTDVAMRTVKESDAGIYVTGARSIATLAPLSNEILVLPSPMRYPPIEAAKDYAVGFAVAADTPGMKMICRPSLAMTSGRFADHPLSARMDEMDAVIWFDNAFIPWERVFVHRNIEVIDAMRQSPAGMHGMHQYIVRALSKAEFFLGIAYNLAEMNANKGAHVFTLLGEMANNVETLRALVKASEIDCRPAAQGTVAPAEEPLQTARAAFPGMDNRMQQILQLLGSGNLVLMPSTAELDGPAADAVEHYCAGLDLPPARKIALVRLAWDASSSAFAGRQNLYEQFFSGDPWKNASMRGERYSHAGELKSRVNAFLDRNESWGAILR